MANVALHYTENEYLRIMTSYSCFCSVDSLLKMCDSKYYHAIFCERWWVYYIQERQTVDELEVYHFHVPVHYGLFFLSVYMDKWTKNTCAHLEQLSLQSASVPLGDPRMNMTP